jgi:hypothetical protein
MASNASILQYAFLSVGLLLTVVAIFVPNAILTAIAYSCLLAGTLFLIGVELTRGGTLLHAAPTAFCSLIIGFMLALTVSYQAPISRNHVSDSYYTFNTLAAILVCIQLYLLNMAGEQKDASVYRAFAWLVGVVALFFALTVNTILRYFTAGG